MEYFDSRTDTTAVFINAYDPLVASELAVLVLDKPNQLCYALLTQIAPGMIIANTNSKMKYIQENFFKMPDGIKQKPANNNRMMNAGTQL